MSRRWTAKCWMGSKSGYVDIEVSANTLGGAKEQLQNIYGAEQIINLREIRGGGEGSGLSVGSGSGGMLLAGLFAGAGLLLYFTPWVLMTVYGAGATWISQKFTGVTLADFADNDEPSDDELKRGMIVLASAILFGGAGFIHGSIWNSDLNKKYNLDGKQTKVEQVRQK